MVKVLIIDDDPFIRELLSERVQRLGHITEEAANLREGLELIERSSFDLVFLDINLPDGDGLNALPAIRQSPSKPDVVMITAVGSAKGAATAIKNGAWDYITKPFDDNELKLLITRAAEYRRVKKKQMVPMAIDTGGIIGQTGIIKECINQIAQCACNRSNVLIQGETGTGKELFAMAIHKNHNEIKGDYVVVDCSAMPETLAESVLFGHVRGAFTGADKASQGLIKQADQGTLFLDEIGELPLSLQKNLLRVLQEKKFRPVGSSQEVSSNFRLISATNRNLDEMVKKGLFREDLFHRLKTISITLPPLRKRIEDIQIIAQHYIRVFSDKLGVKPKALLPETLERLEAYPWPGNVRELVNAVEKAVMAEPDFPILYPMFLPNRIRINYTNLKLSDGNKSAKESSPLSLLSSPICSPLNNSDSCPSLKEFREDTVSRAESIYLESLLALKNWQIDKVLEVSEISKSHLYALIKKYDLKKRE